MPWVKFDDQFPIHRKVEALSNAAFRLHVAAICWCNRNLTDGAIPAQDLHTVAPRKMRDPERYAAELVERGLWHTTYPLGWAINDYLDWQDSKETIQHKRKQNAERQRRHREKGDE